MRRSLLLTVFLCLALALKAQMADPVHFRSELKLSGDNEAEIVFTASIDPGWHVYSTDLGQEGPIEASFTVDRLEGAQLVGKLKPRGQLTEKYDDMFGMTLKYFETKAAFVQRLRFTQPHYVIEGYLEYGACNDQMCLPPTQVEFRQEGDAPVKEKEEAAPLPPPVAMDTMPLQAPPVAADTLVAPEPSPVATDSALWAPVVDQLKAYGEGTPIGDSSLWIIFLSGLLGGLLAVLTPCVWPIIPMTVSFFLKRNKERRKAISEALLYGFSIVVIYVLLGLFVTLIWGANKLNELSTNALFNIFFALLLVVFAASFFGAFELRLPSSWSNKVDQKADSLSRPGSHSFIKSYLSIFLMAFTLALVSFSCTGPIVGFLLVAVSTQGQIVAPVVGMLGFALALAVPFTFFALFPSLMKQIPRSGGWMNTVKVVLGFIELAFALKFLSVADLAYGWHLLDREVFLSIWIVLFGLLGIYLLRATPLFSKAADDEMPEEASLMSRTGGIVCLFLGMSSLAFTVYMVPGLWGAPLKAVSAFAPPMSTQDFNLYQGSVEARFTDYDQGLAAARAEGKPAMIDFTGFGCVNCRKMEAAVWTDPQIQQMLNNDYVLISLYVDDKTPLPGGPVEVTENGQTRRLRTVGDRWSYLQRTKTGQNTQPAYLLLDPATGLPLAALRSYDEDISAYADFLHEGLKRFKP